MIWAHSTRIKHTSNKTKKTTNKQTRTTKVVWQQKRSLAAIVMLYRLTHRTVKHFTKLNFRFQHHYWQCDYIFQHSPIYSHMLHQSIYSVVAKHSLVVACLRCAWIALDERETKIYLYQNLKIKVHNVCHL